MMMKNLESWKSLVSKPQTETENTHGQNLGMLIWNCQEIKIQEPGTRNFELEN